MRIRLVSMVLAAVVVATAYGQNEKAQRPKSYPIQLNADDVREFGTLKINYAGVELSSAGVSGIPISCGAGITGMMLVGNGTFRFAPPEGSAIEGAFRAAMLRFNPQDQRSILPLDNVPKVTDRGIQEMSSHLLKQAFRHCWQANGDALIPDEGSLSVVLYCKEHGDLLISTGKSGIVVHNFSKRETLFEKKAGSR